VRTCPANVPRSLKAPPAAGRPRADRHSDRHGRASSATAVVPARELRLVKQVSPNRPERTGGAPVVFWLLLIFVLVLILVALLALVVGGRWGCSRAG